MNGKCGIEGLHIPKATHSSILAWRIPRTEEPGIQEDSATCICVGEPAWPQAGGPSTAKVGSAPPGYQLPSSMEGWARRTPGADRCAPVLFNIALEVLAPAIREEKEIKEIQIRKEEVKLSLFEDDMTLYIENHKDSIKTLLSFYLFSSLPLSFYFLCKNVFGVGNSLPQ